MLKENKRLSFILEMVDKVTAPSQKVKGSMQELGKSAQGARRDVSALGKQADDLRSMAMMQKSLKASQVQGEILTERVTTLRTAQAATTKQTQQLSDKAASLRVAMQSVEKPTKAMREEVKQAERAYRDSVKASSAQRAELKLAEQAAKGHEKATLKQQDALRQLDEKLRRSGVDTRNLSEAMAQNRTKTSQATAELNRHSEALDKAKNRQEALTRAKARHDKAVAASAKMATYGTAMVAGGAAVAGGVYAAGSPYRDFDKRMSAVQATGAMSSDTKAQLAKAARDAAKVSSFGASDAAMAQNFLAMAGFTPDQIMASITDVLNLAASTDTDLAATADIGSNILSGFGLQADKMLSVADLLTKTTTSSNVDLRMLGETMKYVAPVAKAAGQDIESVAAMSGLLGNVGIQGSQAGTALRGALLRLSGPTKEAQKEFTALGVATKDAAGNVRALPDVLADIARATDKMGTGDRLATLKTMFGEEAAASLAELLDKAGAGEIDRYTAKLRASQGAAAAAAAARLNNLDGEINQFGSMLEEVQLKFGESFDSMYRGIVRFATKGLAALDEWMAANPKMVKAIGLVTTAFGLLLSASGALLIGLGGLWLMFAKMRLVMFLASWACKGLASSLMGFIKTLTMAAVSVVVMIARMAAWVVVQTLSLARTVAMTAAMVLWRSALLSGAAVMATITAAQWAWNVALSANPIGAIIAAVVALVAAGVWLWNNWDTVTAKFAEGWAGIQALLAMDPMDALRTLWAPVSEFFASLWDSVATSMMAKVEEMIGSIMAIPDRLKQAMAGGWEKVKGAGNWALGGFGQLDQETQEAIKEAPKAPATPAASPAPAQPVKAAQLRPRTEVITHAPVLQNNIQVHGSNLTAQDVEAAATRSGRALLEEYNRNLAKQQRGRMYD
ncbi:phage tail tape measure protein [Aeromonas aquatica]|uniref:phage tail tape measure protein n=1 Tax=Aeromonas aquatica TaxID=558964 RepID=UPI000558F576|nr:phage tail tape measure protein [Aeromonas aquatica]